MDITYKSRQLANSVIILPSVQHVYIHHLKAGNLATAAVAATSDVCGFSRRTALWNHYSVARVFRFGAVFTLYVSIDQQRETVGLLRDSGVGLDPELEKN